MSEKIEGVSKVNQSQNVKTEGVEQQGPEKFQEMMESKTSSIQPKFEVLDPKAFANSSIQADIEHQQTHFNDLDVSSNKMGSATDEQGKKDKGNQGSDSDEVEGVSGVSKSKSSSASSSSFIENSGSASGSSPVSIEDIKKQTNETLSRIEETKQQLVQANQANVEIKPSYQKLLKNHLSHIDDNIRIASSKAGIETPNVAPITDAKAANPVERFINMLTSSQAKMKNLQRSVEELAATGKMNPGQMLALQMKSNLISQEMELFSSLLGKALEGIKTIMNVQV